jgi:hypothetical protein
MQMSSTMNPIEQYEISQTTDTFISLFEDSLISVLWLFIDFNPVVKSTRSKWFQSSNDKDMP